MGNKTKYQSFDTETINRSMIKNAEYNPRIMDEKAKKRLKNTIRTHGIVSALTWNKRTGNLVGGHQRLEQLDALEKNPDKERNNAEFYATIVFEDEKDRDEFFKLISVPKYERYITAEQVRRIKINSKYFHQFQNI